MSYLDLRRWKKTIQSDKKMLKFVEEKHVKIRKGRAGSAAGSAVHVYPETHP